MTKRRGENRWDNSCIEVLGYAPADEGPIGYPVVVMKVSSDGDVQAMYAGTASSYDQMMDQEIQSPVYANGLQSLAERIANVSGPVVDVACGSGHMLQLFHDRVDSQRQLLGFDLSEAMVGIAGKRLAGAADVEPADMRNVQLSKPAAAIINFYALHHVDEAAAKAAFGNWFDALAPGGQLWLATWEGQGAIDYGGHADIVALRYSIDQVRQWAESAGFNVDRCQREPIEGFDMDAVFLEASRPG